MTDADRPFADKPKPFLEHLEELRHTALSCLTALAVGMGLAIPLLRPILRWLQAPLNQVTDHPERFLRSLEITGAFAIAVQVVFWSGLLIAMPFLTFFVGRFILPALTARERKAVFGGLGLAVLLFAFGAGLGYFTALPVALKALFQLHELLGIQAEWTAPNYISFTMHVLIAFGLAFELPIVLLILGYLGIVSSALLRTYRRHAIVGLVVLAAVMTPGPDIFSQLVMAVPMVLLYELCVWMIWTFEKKTPKETRP